GLRASMRKMVARLLSEAGVTTILVTHDQSEALSFADQLAVMRKGRLVQAGHPMDLYLRPDDEDTALFLGDAVILPALIENGWAQCELGQLPVNDEGRHGQAQIMLRPEQLQLAHRVSGHVDGNGSPAVVTECDFGGNTCTLTVELKAPAADGQKRALLVRSSGMHAPRVGSEVLVSALGHAHVLGRQSAR
ncbi:MAG: TOBE domain-containing protein, partial [Mycobacterium sp.]|nr:TOBE domain-containing protein [Mycobacterium sp.]